jgi:phosphoribosylanthranilate isomerase
VANTVHTRVKICGITSLEDAIQAIESGADALGFVFYEPSPRYVSPETVSQIVASLPPFITTVGLFVNADSTLVEEVSTKTQISLLQFHGDESEDYCASFSLPYIKAIRVRTQNDIVRACADFTSASGILLDAYKKGVPGGTGEVFDWGMIPKQSDKPLILAGGLTLANVGNAIKLLKPYAVDVSGGVELKKGVKDHLKVSRFLEEVARASE